MPVALNSRARSRRLQGPVLLAAGVLLAALLLRLRDPHVGGSWGLCPLRALTGLDCPACGGLRAVNDLTHLRVDAAFHSNAAFMVAVPLLVGGWAWWLSCRWRGRPGPGLTGARARPFWWAAAALLLVFTVVRNTPWGRAYWA